MTVQYEIKKMYKKNKSLRNSFNELSVKTFGISFEDWFQNGYWGDNYIPYSIVYNNEVIANVSVNLMEFQENGQNKNYIQLGTVMTKEEYRNQGYIRAIMKEIDKDYKDKVNGFYLFANNSVLNFYKKFGFLQGKEYEYTKNVQIEDDICALPISMKSKEDYKRLEDAIKHSVSNSLFEMKNNNGLIMFYITKFMQNNVFYIEHENSYIIAEIEKERLYIHLVIAPNIVSLDSIINEFGKNIKKVTLGFTPIYKKGYNRKEVQEENTTLFLRGSDLEGFNQKGERFPTLSHA